MIEAIRPGRPGANTKAPRIQEVLAELGPEPDLDWLRETPRAEVIDYLTSLPGVGRKTAACVMIFALDRPEIPVDTHVHRVGGRLGLFPPGISLEAAHDEMLAITDPEDAYELHLNLIAHGRTVCRPRPRCGECELARMCVGAAARDGRPGRLRHRVGERVVSAPPPGPMLAARISGMNKRVFLSFLLVAVLLAVIIPLWAFSKDGSMKEETSRERRGTRASSSSTNCGSCHTLEAAGTDGVVGPNLDERLAPTGPAEGDAIAGTEGRVISAIETGLGNGSDARRASCRAQQADQVVGLRGPRRRPVARPAESRSRLLLFGSFSLLTTPPWSDETWPLGVVTVGSPPVT